MNYKVKLEYTEYVKGQPRDFAYESLYEAADFAEACRLATLKFEHLRTHTLVGWNRHIRSVEVKPDEVRESVGSAGDRHCLDVGFDRFP